MSNEPSLMDEFVAEGREHLDNIEEELLELERNCENPDPDLVSKVFRAIHSIKGAAGFLGLKKVNDLSHVMETLLQMIRSGDIKPESVYVDALLEGVDLLKTMFDDISGSNDVEIEVVHDLLSGLTGATPPVSQKSQTPDAAPTSQSENHAGFEINEFILKNIPPSHDYLYTLEYDLSELQENDEMSPLALVKELLSTGNIIDARLESSANELSEELNNKPLLYLVLYSTVLDPSFISTAANLPEDKVTEINYKELQPPLKKEDDEPQKKLAKPKKEEAKLNKKKQGLGASGKKSPPSGDQEQAGTIRINVNTLDKLMTMAGELVLVRNQCMQAVENNSLEEMINISQHLDIVTTELQETIMLTRMQPVGNAFGKLPRIVRDLSKKLNKKIEIKSLGNDVEIDKTILQALTDPLTHLVRNCCDHAIESPDERNVSGKPTTGTIEVHAYHEAGQINIEVRDDGKGLDPEKLREKALANNMKTQEELDLMSEKDVLGLIMLPGFSTAEKVSDVSGRGVGMDVVRSSIESLGGMVDLISKIGEGTTVHMRLPLTLAIIPSLIVGVNGHRYAVPQVSLEELVSLDDEEERGIECAENQEVFRLRDRLLPIVRLAEVLHRENKFSVETRSDIIKEHHQSEKENSNTLKSTIFAVVKVRGQRYGLVVDKVYGTEEIVVKPMHQEMKNYEIYSGATVMGDGKVAMILSIEGISKHAGVQFNLSQGEIDEKHLQDIENTQTVLLFQSGKKEQFAMSMPLIRRIERIQIKDIETIGEKEFITIDDVSTLVLRLDQALDVSEYVNKSEEAYLLLPKHIKRPFGILMSKVVDIVETPMDLNTESYLKKGLLGTSIIQEHITMFIDVFSLIEQAEPEWFSERKGSTAKDSKAHHKVLLVEDAAFFRQLVKGYLESDGYEVETAEDGKVGLDLVHENDFDIIVSDIEMPVMDGFEFISQLRADKEFKKIPVVALTALDSETDREKALSAGFDYYEVKIDRETLLRRVSEILLEYKQKNQG